MTLYLVRLRHTMDDLPLFVCDDLDAAIEFAERHSWRATSEQMEACKMNGMSTPISIDVVEFVGGLPVRVVFVRSREGEVKVNHAD